MKNSTRYWLIGFTGFIILFHSLVPSFYAALPEYKNSADNWTEICSATSAPGSSTNSTAAIANRKSSSNPSQHVLHVKHCSFCPTHCSPGLIPTYRFAIPLAEHVQQLPALFYPALRPLLIWLTPQSRAPPLS